MGARFSGELVTRAPNEPSGCARYWRKRWLAAVVLGVTHKLDSGTVANNVAIPAEIVAYARIQQRRAACRRPVDC